MMNNYSASSAPPPPPFPGAMASQDYPMAQFSATSTPPSRDFMPRQRFGFHAPSPYPRPRSSASKPNPGTSFDAIHEESDNYFPSNNYSFPSNNYSFPSPINEHYSPNQSQPSTFGNSSFNDYLPYNEPYESKSHLYDDSYNNPDVPYPATYDKPVMEYPATSFPDVYGQQDSGYSRPPKNANFSNNRYSNNSFSSQGGDSSYTTCPEGSFTSPSYKFYNKQSSTAQVTKKWGKESRFSNTKGTRRNFKGKKVASNGNCTPLFGGSSYDEGNTGQNIDDPKRPMKRKAPELNLRCELCGISFTSQIPYDMHLTGAKHMKKLKAIEILKLLQSQGYAAAGDSENKVFHCEICNVDLNGALQVQTHYDGNKHKQKLKSLESPEAMDTGNQNSKIPVSATMTTKPKVAIQDSPSKVVRLSCDTCDITVNSDVQLQQHLSSKKHIAKLEGKPLPAQKKRKSGSNTSPSDDDIIPIARLTTGKNLPKVMAIPDIKANFVKAENNE